MELWMIKVFKFADELLYGTQECFLSPWHTVGKYFALNIL